MSFEIGKLTRLPLGWQGENKSRPIRVDVHEWLDEWPGASISLMARRPGEETFYPAETSVENGILTWVPGRADVLYGGEGVVQFILTSDDDVELRSRVVKTIIGHSISGTEGGAPDPETGWVSQVLQAAQEAQEAAESAQAAAQEAQEAANSSGTITLLPETALTYDESSGLFFMTEPWPVFPAEGLTCTVTYNGVGYECTVAKVVDGDLTASVMGKASMVGAEGGNEDAPFLLICYEEANGGVYGGIVPADGAEAVAISITMDVADLIPYVDSNATEPEAEVFTVTASASGDSLTSLTLSEVSHTYDEIIAAMQAGKAVQMLLDVGFGLTVTLPAISRNEDTANQSVLFHLVTVGEESSAITVELNDKTGENTVEYLSFSLGSSGSSGSDGADGADGTDGVGIASVVQTTTSTADGGTNIITVTLTDGSKSTFSVKNGSKGSTGATGATGATGPQGEQGEQGVGIASVEQTTTAAGNGEDNVITVTLTDGTKSTFKVKNGTLESTKLEDLSNVEVHDTAPTTLTEGNWYLVKAGE